MGERDTMSPTSPAVAPPAPRQPLFGSCWGCRILSGLGLMGAGYWVYLGPRRVIKQGVPPKLWHIVQLTFALSLISWGVVVMTNPVGSVKRKDE